MFFYCARGTAVVVEPRQLSSSRGTSAAVSCGEGQFSGPCTQEQGKGHDHSVMASRIRCSATVARQSPSVNVPRPYHHHPLPPLLWVGCSHFGSSFEDRSGEGFHVNSSVFFDALLIRGPPSRTSF